MIKNRVQQHKGFALLIALIVSSVVLAIGVSILSISVNQINLSASARESEFAFQAAHAGIDCMWYWRNSNNGSNEYTSLPARAKSIACFGLSPISASPVQSPANVFKYEYNFDWGTPDRCTQVDFYIMNASALSTNLTMTAPNEAVGNGSTKSCNAGNVCTIIISSGYNRACTEISNSIFSVQRELTVEF